MRPAATVLLLVTAALAASPADEARLAGIDLAVNEAIRDGRLPGAVVLVGQDDRDLYLKAFGDRALVPKREPMTADTIFDAASLTKVVATATSVMVLLQEGRIRLADRVSAYIPEFGTHGKEEVTIRHLLTHVSGLRPDLDLETPFDGYARAVAMAAGERLQAQPGERFIYSDINFFLLGDIVARVSGQPLDEFARTRIFVPLGMRDTGFRPAAALRPRIAPTEACEPLAWPCGTPGAPMLRGIVHDPTARRMGGVAGHAGLFTTAADLARFCRMILNRGELDGARILAPLAVDTMTRPASPRGHASVRGLGWDIDSQYSASRGDLFPIGSFGHTGFTGTSIWIDPSTRTFVVFLSNRVHPDGKGDVTPLRGRVATIAASAVLPERAKRLPGAVAATVPVLAGIDVLRAEDFARLKGKRIGLLTNAAARTRDGGTTLEAFGAAAEKLTLVALFSAEHGLAADLDEEFGSSRDARRGVPVHSLYGGTRRPDPSTLDGLDAVVVDLPDVGARFYTYMTTVALVMEEAAKKKVPVVVLDRPNPIGGELVEGPLLDRGLEHFAGYFPMPIRHGLTMGELARLFNGEKGIGAELSVVEARGWTRGRWFDETGLAWHNPSPNIRNLHQAALYPGIGAIEWSNISVGRGTDAPFEQVGAPWVDGGALAEVLNAREIPGVSFYPVRFTPASSVYAKEECGGVFVVITDRAALRPVRVGVEVASALYRLYPKRYDFKNTVRLLGAQEAIDRIRRGDDPAAIAASWADAEARWRERRAPYLLYP
jgi:uncharacterized protein YbbC (DUF1343 family)